MKGFRWQALALIAAVIAAGSLLAAGHSHAQDRSPVSASQPASFADVVERVSGAVVNIAVSKTATTMPTSGVPGRSPRGSSPFDEFFGRYFDVPDGRGFPMVPKQQGEGSGFIVDTEGFIATNYHVVDGAEEIVVTLPSGEKLDAHLVGQDSRTDLALIKVDAPSALAALEFGDSDSARVGDWVLAIGNPFGLGGTATAGIISARGRDIQSGPYDDYLQIDAPINSGNSGGPVFNTAGQVIGINTAIFSPNGGNIGIGFAIPSNQARDVIAELKEHGSLRRGWLGVEIQTIDEALVSALSLDESAGVLVTQVVPDGPADRAGLAAGDVVTRFESERVDSARTLGRLVGSRRAGDRVELRFLRDGSAHELRVELGEFDEPERVASYRPRPG